MKKIKIPVEKAIGMPIEHDITKIDKDSSFKGTYFKKGHIIKKDDVSELKKLGKNYIYKLMPSENDVHEDEFAKSLSPLLAGKNIRYSNEPSEGKIGFFSTINGLFKVDKKRLFKLNELKDLSFPTISNNFPVEADKLVAAFRIIPLFTSKKVLNAAKKRADEPIISVKPYTINSVNVIITGNEIYSGLVEDKFKAKLVKKLMPFNVKVKNTKIVADDVNMIKKAFFELIDTQMLIVTGGSSVDPDDVTKKSLKKCGVKFIREGNPIQPANNFTLGYYKDVTVCVLPAGALYYKASAFDIYLPRILSEDKITKKDIVSYALGGLCHFCKVCTYPICPFGRS